MKLQFFLNLPEEVTNRWYKRAVVVAAATEMSVLITVRDTITPSLVLDILKLAPELKAMIPKKNINPIFI